MARSKRSLEMYGPNKTAVHDWTVTSRPIKPKTKKVITPLSFVERLANYLAQTNNGPLTVNQMGQLRKKHHMSQEVLNNLLNDLLSPWSNQ